MKEYKIGRYYIENLNQFREARGNDLLERSTCLVLDEVSHYGERKILEVNFFNFNIGDTPERYYTSGITTIPYLNELGITIKRYARINEIFEFCIGLKNYKDDEFKNR